MKVKNEMIEFVSENFEVIKNNFLKSEMNILEEMFEDEMIDKDEFKDLSEFLIDQMNVLTTEELIDVINERSIGVEFEDDDDCNNLFNMIKAMKEVAI